MVTAYYRGRIPIKVVKGRGRDPNAELRFSPCAVVDSMSSTEPASLVLFLAFPAYDTADPSDTISLEQERS